MIDQKPESTKKESQSAPVINVNNLRKVFGSRSSWMQRKTTQPVVAVENVSLQVHQGETLGLVGESGCGKSTLGRMLLGLIAPSEGEIWFKDHLLCNATQHNFDPYRGRLQMIFQDPASSLNPKQSIQAILREALLSSKSSPSTIAETDPQVDSLLDMIGISIEQKFKYPHEFSGGQKQRINIARAMATHPEFVFADEPVSALDVSVQAQITNLLFDLQQKEKLSFLFVSHDLAVVRHVSHRIAVMFRGSIVEIGETDQVCSHPLHPYTKKLFETHQTNQVCSSVPQKIKRQTRSALEAFSNKGCAFMPHCSQARAGACDVHVPFLQEKNTGHWVACPYSE